MEKLQSALLNLLGRAEIIILDAAAGLGREAQAAIEVADEIIVVTNPELPAVADALKTIKVAEENGTKILGVVVNRHSGKRHMMRLEEINQILQVPILAVIPEDIKVQESIANKMPVVKYSPRSKAAREFKRLAAYIAGAGFEPLKERSFVERLFGWLS
jgi:septum site-determining protein MinD